MGSLFQGKPLTAKSYVKSTTETPEWLQDAIYNQIYLATGVANTPYEAYTKQITAGPSENQTAAWQAVQAAQGAYKPMLQAAQTGVQDLSKAPGGAGGAQLCRAAGSERR